LLSSYWRTGGVGEATPAMRTLSPRQARASLRSAATRALRRDSSPENWHIPRVAKNLVLGLPAEGRDSSKDGNG
jgi:hypothetical protein